MGNSPERPWASKLPNVGTTIFSVMSKLAQVSGAINLSQGFPDFPIDEKLSELTHAAMRAGHNQYAPMPGLASLRDAIAAKVERLYGFGYDPDTEVTVTAGATQALFTAIGAIVQPGDEVVIIDPAYDCYAPAVELFGGTPVHVRLGNDMKFDADALRRAITPRTRMLMINTPHNPAGTILRDADMRAITDILRGTDIFLVSDEVYEHLVFDREQHTSVIRYPELRDRAIVVYSFGKVFHATGWKMGYVLAPKALMAEFRKVHQFNVFSVNTPMQYALAEYLKDPCITRCFRASIKPSATASSSGCALRLSSPCLVRAATSSWRITARSATSPTWSSRSAWPPSTVWQPSRSAHSIRTRHRANACSDSASRSRMKHWTTPLKSYARSKSDTRTEHAPLGECNGQPHLVRR